jgi:ATP synthase protein I
MPQHDDGQEEALERLEGRLDALESERSRGKYGGADAQAMSTGYRFLASMIGGVLTGVGFGWLVDRFADTGPWGLIGGLLIGTGVSTYSVIRTAGRMSNQAAKDHPPQAVPYDDDEDE